MIRVTLTINLSDLWGADEAFARGGSEAIKELAAEDQSAFLEEATWKIEQFDPIDELPTITREEGLRSRTGHPTRADTE